VLTEVVVIKKGMYGASVQCPLLLAALQASVFTVLPAQTDVEFVGVF
jgi:hypothetical protein